MSYNICLCVYDHTNIIQINRRHIYIYIFTEFMYKYAYECIYTLYDYMSIYVYTHHITSYVYIYIWYIYTYILCVIIICILLWYSSATVHFKCQDSQAVHVQSPGSLQTSLRGRATSPEQRRRGAAGRLRCGATSGPFVAMPCHAGSHGMIVFMGKWWAKYGDFPIKNGNLGCDLLFCKKVCGICNQTLG